LLGKYLEEGDLSNEEIKRGIRSLTIANQIVPAFCGSAFKNKGVQAMLDAVVEYMPAPTDVEAIKGILVMMLQREFGLPMMMSPLRHWRLKSQQILCWNLNFF